MLGPTRFDEALTRLWTKNYMAYSDLMRPTIKRLHARSVIAELCARAIGKPLGVQFAFRDVEPDGIVQCFLLTLPCHRKMRASTLIEGP